MESSLKHHNSSQIHSILLLCGHRQQKFFKHWLHWADRA